MVANFAVLHIQIARQSLRQQFKVESASIYSKFFADGQYLLNPRLPQESRIIPVNSAVERLAGLIAPVLCHMAEDIWQNLPYPVAEASVFERGWPTAPAAWRHGELEAPMERILALRALVNRQLEACRSGGQ